MVRIELNASAHFTHGSGANHALFKAVEWILTLQVLKYIQNGIRRWTDVENILQTALKVRSHCYSSFHMVWRSTDVQLNELIVDEAHPRSF